MSTMENLSVDSLQLDYKNFRTTEQKDETHAINALISINPDWFWALVDSLLEDGYHPTENIIILNCNGKSIVREGNRRIAALKIILGQVKNVEIDKSYIQKIRKISKKWKEDNEKVPCTIYDKSESKVVDKIVARIHAKGEKAGRSPWTSVARARYERDKKDNPEPGLDLLEKYLEKGKNLTPVQAERWSGDYPITVLNEVIRIIHKPLGYKSQNELCKNYPKKNKAITDKILYDIGMKFLGFKDIRKKDFGTKYGIKTSLTTENISDNSTTSAQTESSSTISTKRKAEASNDPKSVYRKLKSFKPRGPGREKIVTLLKEIRTLKLDKQQHSFCFLLRSMFEISAKAYCKDHKSSGGPDYKKKDGRDKPLVNILRDITKYMIKNDTDKNKVRELHGAITELAKSDGLLSVTSMNQLIHNPSFSILPGDISILFGNIFPLLEEMNK